MCASLPDQVEEDLRTSYKILLDTYSPEKAATVGITRAQAAALFGLKTANGVDYLVKTGKLNNLHSGRIAVDELFCGRLR